MGGKEKSGASASSLGRALVRQHNQKLQQSKDKGAILRSLNKKVLTSYTETTDIEAVIEQAEEAARIHSLSNPAPTLSIDIDEESLEDAGEVRKQEEALYATSLRVPRRPPWTSEMSVEELDANEKQSFLEWRRRLARVEENEKLFLTPFEKNLDIWRQLWRVLERSDLLVMVVDGRNPLFYRCPDLEAYAQEINEHKKTMLLVNKADLLPLSVRKKWAKYFEQHGILFLFWSAKAASDFLDNRKSGNQSHSSHESDLLDEDVKIYNRIELLARLQTEAEIVASRKDANKVDKRIGDYSSHDSEKGAQKPVVVGFVGYPNVGKSSTINALVGEKRTGVTSTPGKTKHFQTLIISEKLVLCDCPGLVFPSFSSSRYEMIASGVLPVDRMTSHREAVQVVANHVPRHAFNNVYNITLPKPKSYEVQSRPPLAAELLRTYCSSRGYVVASGLPDEMKAARLILKDYIDGKLPHFEIPPDMAADGDMEETVDPDSMSCDSCVSDEVDPSMGDLDENDIAGKPKLDRYVDELDSFDGISGLSVCISKKEKKTKASSKYHKKPQRNKDRSWRVGNDGGDGMPVSRVLQKNPLPSSKYVT